MILTINIATYNRGDILLKKEALRSIKAKHLKIRECIIVDGGTDNTSNSRSHF
jgi:glycosyltransferase involved in cell wall biosynthesis